MVRGVGPDDIAETLEAAQELVHGLLAHPGALSECAGANTIRPRKLQHRHVRHAKIVEPSCIHPLDDPALNGLTRHAEQRPDEHVFRLDHRAGWRRMS